MRTAIFVACLLATAALGLVAEPVAAEDPTEWCDVHVGDPTPTGVTCGPEGPVCGGVVVGGEHACKP